ncbi:response regulator [Pseudalkalibacillus hwajinpoensis]|uniref:response regulator n=1 Tax=Guptibacillus hwajinpoensis TaxID=208199 RepID=UPI00325B1D5C
MIHVMIIEDDPMVAQLNKRYVEEVDGFTVSCISYNSDEAISNLSIIELDLILLDVYLPGMNGLELLKLIRERNQDVDVILITAASEINQIQQALRLGAIDYLIKPFDFDRFQEALLKYKNNYYRLNEKNKVNQEELDHMLHINQQHAEKLHEQSIAHSLPKGLTKNTLNTINQTILSLPTAQFSTEDIAHTANISRVSVRKYLKFLRGIGYLEESLTYGVGRPIYQYALNPANRHSIDPYLD